MNSPLENREVRLRGLPQDRPGQVQRSEPPSHDVIQGGIQTHPEVTLVISKS